MSLYQLMLSLCKDPDLQEPLPEYRISGNQLELNVPSCPSHTESGRMAIIQAGLILERLSRQARQEGNLQIRIFPSLDHPQLIALATLYRDRNGTRPRPVAQTTGPGESLPSLLQAAAARTGLYFHPLPEGFRLPRGLQRPAASRPYVLCSRADNPFVWIKTGQWIDQVERLVKKRPDNSLAELTCQLSAEERVPQANLPDECVAIQAVAWFSC